MRKNHIPNLHDVKELIKMTVVHGCLSGYTSVKTPCLHLNHPYNDICDTNTYAKPSVIKNFMAVYTNPQYLTEETGIMLSIHGYR